MTGYRYAAPPGRPPLRERFYAGAGAAVIVGLLGYGLLLGLDVPVLRIRDRALAVLDIRVPPPPPPKQERPPPEHPRPRAKEAPAPPNLRNKATPVVAPPPIVHLPPPPPVVVAPIAGAGMAANAGAAERPGPGTGAGGRGNGLGGGGDGDGEGDDTPPEFLRGDLKFSDLPAELRAMGAQGSVDVRYRVEVSGRVTGCQARVKSGPAALGPATCAAIERKFRYRPSLDPDGRPVAASIYENQSWVIDREAAAEER